MAVQMITPQQLFALSSRTAVDLFDVRTPAEYREVHIDGARLIPLDRLDPQKVMAARTSSPDQPLYLVCRSGSRAKRACELLVQRGIANVALVEGGTLGWEQAGLPVVRGRKAVSLERQVRIAAGSLVLIGAVLGALAHPGFIALSAFVGAGLIFAGITDRCWMALLLGRMPWNQAGRDGESADQGRAPAACRAVAGGGE
jgi:rhodanese-related sulfurtransferase